MDFKDTEFEQYAQWQVSQLRDGDETFWDRLSEAEYQAVASELPEPPKRVLDLGCGLGRVGGHFVRYWPSPPTTYYMADSTGADPTWEWNAGKGFYNDLRLTGEYMKRCGAGQVVLVDLAKGELDKLRNIDLIVSFLAVGFHYPLKQYLSRLLKIAAPRCVMAFGIRRGTIANPDKFLQWFDSQRIVAGLTRNERTGAMTKEDVLVLKREAPK